MDEQRAEFEAWAKSKGAPKDGWWIRQIDDGGYSCHAVDMAWDAWQAATQRQQERIAYVEKVADDAIELGNQQAKRIADLEAQVQALSMDAERYRWLASVCESDGSGYWLTEMCVKEGEIPPCKQDVDASIDAAIARATHKEGA